MKKKILLIESVMHFWQIPELHKLFSKNFDCHVLIPKKSRHLVSLKNDIITSPLRLFIFFHAILIGKKYDYIYLVTSPEYPEYPTNLKTFFEYFQQLFVFLILTFFFRKKLILYVRGIYRLIPEIHPPKKKFYIYLRKKIFFMVNRFVCENKNLENIFREKFLKGEKKIYLTTLYTRFFDPEEKIKKKLNKDLLTIGILGAIDPIRKDYDIIYDFVRRNKTKIKLIFLGKKYKKLSDPVLKKFSNFNLITKDYLTDKDFIELGSQCDILLSLNKEGKLYGSFKGTGSYGDALKLQQILISQVSTDPIKEFSKFTLYYNNKDELEDILEKFFYNRNIFKPDFPKFSIDELREKSYRELNLNN